MATGPNSFTELNGVQTQTGKAPFFSAAGLNSLGTFIPEIWAAQYLEDLMSNLVIGSPLVVNRQYEGEIQGQGDTVRIPHHGNTTVAVNSGYTPYSDIPSPDRATIDSMVLRINDAFTMGFEVDDLHQLQTAAGIDLLSALFLEQARATAEAFDKRIVNSITQALTGKDSNNVTGGTPTVPTYGNLHGTVAKINLKATDPLYEGIVQMRLIMDINNVPQAGRYLVVGPLEYSSLLKDTRFITANAYGGSSVIIHGEVGQILGLPVLVSNTIGGHFADATLKLLPGVVGNGMGERGTKQKGVNYEGIQMFTGHNMAVTMATQLTRLEAYRPQARFTTAVKGLTVFGAKVIRPEALVVATLPYAP
jgi:hypothetical protein